MRVAGMGSMRSSINMLGPGLLLKPNILAMGKPKATIFITNLGLVLQPKPKTPIPLTNLFHPPPPGHHPRTELPVAGGTKSWAAVEVGGYRARQVPGTSAADVEGGNDRAVGVAGLSS